jgi:hypothetical protein
MDTALIDVFSGDAFSVRTLTAAVNMMPIQYGLVNDMGIFAEEGVTTTLVSIEQDNGVLNLIQTTERGKPAPKNKTGKRKAIPLEIPHIPLDDIIYPADIQNVREFGTMNLQSPSTVVNDRLVKMGMKHDITLEWHKVNALQGKILDADGSTLLNLFTTFGVTEQSVDFVLGTDTTDLNDKCQDVAGLIEDNLLGDSHTGKDVLWSPELWKRFTTHKSVKDAFSNYQNMVNVAANYAGPTANPTRNDVRQGFVFGGLTHRQYRGKATDAKGNSRQFINANTGRAFPTGTTNTFKHFNAPANLIPAVNTKGLRRYAQVVVDPAGRWVEVFTEQNPLPLCLQPKTLIKIFSSN